MKHLVYISVGSNLDSRISHLKNAVQQLTQLSEQSPVFSAVYETRPVGYTDQPDFLNMVVGIHTSLRPRPLLQRLLQIEAGDGRQRIIRFGPRTLDLDILLFDKEYVCFKDLQIPHPRMWQRAFVLVPLAELEPLLRAPGGTSIRDLAKSLGEGGDVQYVGRFW
ncbi:2-amino-4-hydroxy-6-hydroxymethyldihydropteridine diphosphokinase [Alicyclobacillus tolerans]|uniref:2-amino-4-hydroxy-6- hydroxymethyldihydropteridine diphosphokinase n=1 Tax=Alicyclobacillus tolerans TaxID=90970 RepID=UPI0023510A1C|nr:2-amino-4-hydroxy-6-hydroxymethyldihydropteridine diphosphokinase [Alicyclobacillus tolerans]MCF8568247.1 2-amino-4-hydroxy-6-hydroxymethyldihydropteridine diphosphokinase [Alicyclobacillus tolerans]